MPIRWAEWPCGCPSQLLLWPLLLCLSLTIGCSVPAAWLNDGYCDCDDGSDEPRTAACAGLSRHSFACRQAVPPLSPMEVPTSHIDDGVCDCCDGSDEPPGLCPDTCAAWRLEAGQRAGRRQTDLTQWLRRRTRLLQDVSGCLKRTAQHYEAITQRLQEMLQQIKRLQSEEGDSSTVLAMYQQFMVMRNIQQSDEAVLVAPAKAFGSTYGYCLLRETCFSHVSNEKHFRGGSADPETLNFNFTVCPFRFVTQTPVTPNATEESRVLLGGFVGWERTRTPLEELEDRRRQRQQEAERAKRIELERQAEAQGVPDADAALPAGVPTTRLQAGIQAEGPRNAPAKLPADRRTTNQPHHAVASAAESRPAETPQDREQELLTRFGFRPGDADTSQTLFFAGGEPCWGGPERSVRVTLRCGVAGLTNAREDGKCTYAFDLEHPLACTPEMLAQAREAQLEDDEEDF
eukprot:GGOE01018086.1.p1 GENE.GGOE01018086.1~~GGOE01018086.1.p1  ORF type:complete len:461 (+),score=90.59 GGOE01018086.1:55-1437(+)